MGVSAPTSTTIFYPTSSGNTGSVITTSDIDLIYPFNHDLKSGTATSAFRVYTAGAVGSRVCTIQFKSMADKLDPIQYTNIEFQIKLYETSNAIEFIYGNWTSNATTATSILVQHTCLILPNSELRLSKNPCTSIIVSHASFDYPGALTIPFLFCFEYLTAMNRKTKSSTTNLVDESLYTYC